MVIVIIKEPYTNTLTPEYWTDLRMINRRTENFFFGSALRHTNKAYMTTFQLYWWRPQVPLHALFQAQADTWVDTPSFHKPTG